MTDLHEIQCQIVERIGAAPVGSWLRFKLMDAADGMSLAIAAEQRQTVGAEIDGNQSERPALPSPEGGAQLEGNQA